MSKQWVKPVGGCHPSVKVSWSVNERLWKSGRAVWRNHFQPPAANILSAASLARQGLMTEVKFMHLGSYQDKILDISSIPLLDLVKLSHCLSQLLRHKHWWLPWSLVSGRSEWTLLGGTWGYWLSVTGRGRVTALSLATVGSLSFPTVLGNMHVNTEYGNQMEECALKVGWQKNMMVIIAIWYWEDKEVNKSV